MMTMMEGLFEGRVEASEDKHAGEDDEQDVPFARK